MTRWCIVLLPPLSACSAKAAPGTTSPSAAALVGTDAAPSPARARAVSGPSAPDAAVPAPLSIADTGSAAASTTGPGPGCPTGMAAVTGGDFKMGELGNAVTVRPFCLDLTEVTAGAYAQCVNAHNCSDEGLRCGAAATYGNTAKSNHPINCVTWAQADQYCRAQRKRLPTEGEWEWAARGRGEARELPWGDGAAEAKVCWSGGRREREGTCPVGEFAAGDAVGGIHDLAGNVWEWTASYYNQRDHSRVNRGGGWISNRLGDLRVSNRYSDDPTHRTDHDGFRCAR